MVLSIFVIILFIISGSITFTVLSNYIYKKSFYQIYSALSKPHQTIERKIRIINNLYDYIQEYSDEEILIFNFRFNRFKSNQLYSAIFIVILNISIYAMLEIYFSFYSRIFILLLIFLVHFLLIIFVLRSFGILGFDVKSIKNISDIFNLVLFRVVFTFIISLISILFVLVIFIQYVELKFTTSFFDVFTPYINSGGLESISSSQFSLAGFFFTFAIGGTIIFSIISNYLKQKNELEDTFLEDSDSYIKWFENNENNLIFKIQDITKIDSKIKGYFKALKDLRSKLNFDNVNELIVPIKRYETFRSLIAIMYFLGILTLLLTEPLANYLFLTFILFSFLFMLSIYQIFKEYS